MSFNNDGQTCALCHAYLFPEDDVVCCPVCGAPHHRECYNKLGKCALEELHGTENQYDKLKRAAEEKQAQQEAEEKETTQSSYETPFGTMLPFDFLGGVKPEDEVADGITAKETAKFVLSNTMRYIPKFKKLGKNKKASWNFLAFIFPCGWFLSRKMYLKGIVVGVLEIIATLLTIPFQNTLYNLGISGMVLQPQMIEKLSANMDKLPPILLYTAFFGSALSIAISVLSGIFGDYIYKKHTINSINDIKANSQQKEIDFRKRGGVSMILFFVGVFALQYIPIIIVGLI